MEEKKKSSTAIIVILFLIIVALGGFIAYDKLLSKSNKTTTNVEANETLKDNEQKIEETTKDTISNINKRLYSVNSDMHQQRYYLLLDDATYGMEQNFLNKKTYILDMNIVNGNEVVKEVDMAAVFKPVAEKYINEHKGNNTGTCTVEYFSATNSMTPPPIDYEKEVAFKGYYRCVNGNAETSLGSEIYAYNVETNSIRDLGASN